MHRGDVCPFLRLAVIEHGSSEAGLDVWRDGIPAPTAADPVGLLDVASGGIDLAQEVADGVLELSVGWPSLL